MPAASAKFKFLENAKNLLGRAGEVPGFQILPIQSSPPHFDLKDGVKYILRSALTQEGEKGYLLSGKSLSIGGIGSSLEFRNAYQCVLNQTGLTELILQIEIDWSKHLTVWVEGDFFIFEERDRNGQVGTFFYNPLTRSQEHPELNRLSAFLSALKPLLKQESSWLLEAGIDESGLHLFQIQPVSKSSLSILFSTELAHRQILSQQRFSKQRSVFDLLRTEWSAFRFRRKLKGTQSEVSDVFLNWEFLFHYFKIHCMVSRKSPSAESFTEFLNYTSQSPDHLATLAKAHLKIANQLRDSEPLPFLSVGFHDSSMLFIGNGTLAGTLGIDILWQEDPSLALIYSDSPPLAILTSNVSLLSHPALACAERGIGLVLGMPARWNVEKEGKRIKIDFKNKLLHLD